MAAAYNINRMMSVYVFVILSACIVIITNQADAAHETTNVFKPAEESDISEAEDSSTPWVKDDFKSKIQEFKDNVFEDLKTSPQIDSIWDFSTDSKTTRDIFFKLLNKFFTDIDHPVPSAFANVVSECGSLFDPITMPVMFEADAVSLAEFLLAHDIELDRSTSQRYVEFISSALGEADLDDPESVWQAFLDGYVGFIQSYGFSIPDEVDEFLLLFSSELIVLYNNLNGLP